MYSSTEQVVNTCVSISCRGTYMAGRTCGDRLALPWCIRRMSIRTMSPSIADAESIMSAWSQAFSRQFMSFTKNLVWGGGGRRSEWERMVCKRLSVLKNDDRNKQNTSLLYIYISLHSSLAPLSTRLSLLSLHVSLAPLSTRLSPQRTPPSAAGGMGYAT